MVKQVSTRPPRRSEAAPIRLPSFDFSVPALTPDSDAGLLEAARRLDAFYSWWNGNEYRSQDGEEGSEREYTAWGDAAWDLETFIGTAPAFTPAGVLAKFRRVVNLANDLSAIEGGEDMARTICEALERLAGKAVRS